MKQILFAYQLLDHADLVVYVLGTDRRGHYREKAQTSGTSAKVPGRAPLARFWWYR